MRDEWNPMLSRRDIHSAYRTLSNEVDCYIEKLSADIKNRKQKTAGELGIVSEEEAKKQLEGLETDIKKAKEYKSLLTDSEAIL